ncbi:MAG: XRE family transcriptional regulator, partial [Cyanobacteria bacterium]|nr:XRE family transcriptional regulator [Cyanobacteriota bacterium]
GLLPVPSAYQTPELPLQPTLDGAGAAALSEQWRGQLVQIAKQHGIGVMEALSSAAKAAPARQRQVFLAVLAGFETYAPEQLQGLWDGEAWLPQRWLQEWASKASTS